MSIEAKIMHSIRCDHPDVCSAELESYDGGAWLYDTPHEAREAAYDADWAVNVDGLDFCERHRPDGVYAMRQMRAGRRQLVRKNRATGQWCWRCTACGAPPEANTETFREALAEALSHARICVALG